MTFKIYIGRAYYHSYGTLEEAEAARQHIFKNADKYNLNDARGDRKTGVFIRQTKEE